MYLKSNFSSAILLFGIIISNLYLYSKFNLLFDATQSPDFNMYSQYILYFFGLTDQTNLDNGSLYYYLVSIVLSFYDGFYAGNNYLIIFNNAVQILNLVLSFIGLIGLYLYFIKKNYKKNSVLLALIMLNFFPPFLEMKVTMKPEIFVFALAPYLMITLEDYFNSKKNSSLYMSILLYVTISSLRVSIFIIFTIFLIFLYYKNIKTLHLKTILLNFFFIILVAFPIALHDYDVNGYSYFSNSEVRNEISSGNYDNKAPVSSVLNINFSNLALRPYLDNHADSFIGITLIDTFNDYFHLYWNQDKTFMNRNQKIKNYDFNNFYANKFFDNIEYYFSIVLSIFFYFSIIFFYKQNKSLKILLAPFIGMSLLIINSFGFPYNNFDPTKGDTYKTFYYSFLLGISFLQLVLTLDKKPYFSNISKKIIYAGIFILIIMTSLGFPKFYTQDMTETMKNQNGMSPFCSVNNLLVDNFSDSDCFVENKNFCGWSNNYREPEILENGDKEYFVDDKFGMAILTNGDSFKEIFSFAECEDLKENGYKFFISEKNLLNFNVLNFYLVLVLLIILIRNYKFFRFNKSS